MKLTRLIQTWLKFFYSKTRFNIDSPGLVALFRLWLVSFFRKNYFGYSQSDSLSLIRALQGTESVTLVPQ